jgi:preprotein translocase YajC subunit
MTPPLALLHVVATATKTTSSNPTFLFVLLGIAIIGYFFFLRPQQKKAQAARANVGKGYEVGDEVQTIGGVIGTILEIHGERYTLLTGATEEDGNLGGAQPTRIVFVRQAIARKVERIADVEVDDDDDDEDAGAGAGARGSVEHEGYGLPAAGHDADHDHGVDDEGPSAEGPQAQGGEADQA